MELQIALISSNEAEVISTLLHKGPDNATNCNDSFHAVGDDSQTQIIRMMVSHHSRSVAYCSRPILYYVPLHC